MADKTQEKKWEIVMAEEPWDLFWSYTDLMPGEVGCLGYATVDAENKEVYVDEIFLVPQEADASQVDFIETGLPYAIEKALADGRLDDLKFCIHSHGTYGTTFSNTDEDMIRKMGLTTDFFVSVIFNRAHNTNGRIDTFNLPPLGKMQVTIKDVAVVKERPTWEYEQARIAELEHFVAKPKPKTPPKTTSTEVTKTTGKSVMSPLAAEKAAREMGFDQMAWDDTVDGAVSVGTITLDEVEKLAGELGLGKAQASDGTTYYYGMGGEVFIEIDPRGNVVEGSLNLSGWDAVLA